MRTAAAPDLGAVRRLQGAATSVVQDAEWLESCAAVFAEPRRTRVVAVDGAVAVLAHGGPRAPWWEVPGAVEVTEPVDVLAADADAAARLAEALAAQALPLMLRRVPRDSPVVDALERAYGPRAVRVRRDGPGTPYVDLAGLDAPDAVLNSGRRSDLRRARRRAEALGPVGAQVHAPGPGEVDALLDAALAVELRSWKGPAGTALLRDPVREGFYRRYARAAAGAGVLRVALLHVGDDLAAMQLAVERHGALWLLKIGYDEAFARVSPGQLLLAEVIGWSLGRGLDRVEMLGQEEAWTRVWTPRVRPHVQLGLFPRSSRGLAALGVGAAQQTRRRVSDRLARG
ncbi:GNAT family N-acetyltransferase [Nocardioides kribbensis]|uniref:GNAT family N-acetyltransferase n=1 Tax=Nocardioides kribbensis TaxID=305517 RepID=UPI00187A9C00|nr:GNAT family N-acetyltransferase [Nocardioides kribbensis]